MTNPDLQNILVLSWNLHKGRSPLGIQVWPAMLTWLSTIHADIFFLQETSARRISSKKSSPQSLDTSSLPAASWHCQASEIATSLGLRLALGQNVFKTTRRHGNAILSPHALELFGKWDISAHRFERRGLLVANTAIAGKKVLLLCVHLALTRKARIGQMQWIADWIEENASTGPLILAGDFNDWKNDSEKIFNTINLIEVASTLGQSGLTFPSFSPKLGLDKIYVRDLIPYKWLAPSSNVEWLSDHLPYIVQLNLKNS